MRRVGSLLALALIAAGCAGRPLKFDESKIERKCGVEPGVEIVEDQARCIARLAGLRDKKRCPLVTNREDGASGPVLRVAESCGTAALHLAGNGRVVAVELGEAIEPD
jgi:hypothetical protein